MPNANREAFLKKIPKLINYAWNPLSIHDVAVAALTKQCSMQNSWANMAASLEKIGKIGLNLINYSCLTHFARENETLLKMSVQDCIPGLFFQIALKRVGLWSLNNCLQQISLTPQPAYMQLPLVVVYFFELTWKTEICQCNWLSGTRSALAAYILVQLQPTNLSIPISYMGWCQLASACSLV